MRRRYVAWFVAGLCSIAATGLIAIAIKQRRASFRVQAEIHDERGDEWLRRYHDNPHSDVEYARRREFRSRIPRSRWNGWTPPPVNKSDIGSYQRSRTVPWSRVGYHRRLAEKYRRAFAVPWLPVLADPRLPG